MNEFHQPYVKLTPDCMQSEFDLSVDIREHPYANISDVSIYNYPSCSLLRRTRDLNMSNAKLPYSATNCGVNRTVCNLFSNNAYLFYSITTSNSLYAVK